MREAQAKVKAFCEENNLDAPAEARLLDLASEMGEVAKEILKSSDYGKKKAERTAALEEEMGDLLFSAMTIANKFDIDLDKALEKALEKYEARLASKGSADSGR
jgi:NTP pyrophosphatase (non-canonical NTP hydrolase)